MLKDKPIEQRCRYKTERLLVENWRHQISTSLSELDFAKKIEENSSYKLIDEKKESKVALLVREDFKDRKMNFNGL